MQQAAHQTFNRMHESLRPRWTTQWTDNMGAMLAYLDCTEAGDRAEVTVFIPWRGTARHYSERPLDKAKGIVERHLTGEGYLP